MKSLHEMDNTELRSKLDTTKIVNIEITYNKASPAPYGLIMHTENEEMLGSATITRRNKDTSFYEGGECIDSIDNAKLSHASFMDTARLLEHYVKTLNQSILFGTLNGHKRKIAKQEFKKGFDYLPFYYNGKRI